MGKKGQIAVEYVILVAIVTALSIAMLLISMYYSRHVETVVETSQVDRLGRQIVDTAETVFFYGVPSKSTIKTYMPNHVTAITVHTNELVFTIKTAAGTSDIGYVSAVPLQGSMSPTKGLKTIVIEAREGLVWINGTG